MSQKWFRMSVCDTIQSLRTDPEQGLSTAEVEERRKIYGENSLPDKPPKSFFSIFFGQFKEFLIIVLLIATIVSFALGEVKDGLAIFIIVFLNSLLGASQEFKAEKTLASLKSLTPSSVKTLRDKSIETLPPEELVPGDILLLEEGEKMPADVRWISTNSLQVNEAILTGESEAVRKDADFVANGPCDLGEQVNMGMKGTFILSGKGKAVVTGTGADTALGRIATMLSEIEEEPTPLQRELSKLGKQITILILGVVVLLLIIGLAQQREFIEIFLTSVSLAVAAIPEGLPAVITILLALGVQKMASKNAIVRQLSAVEALGATTVICTDKTGTLTENRMEMVKAATFEQTVEAKDFHTQKDSLSPLFFTALLCTDVHRKENTFHGDPIEVALWNAAIRAHFPTETWTTQYQKYDEIPFSSSRKRVSMLYTGRETGYVVTKGAAELLIAKSDKVRIGKNPVPLDSEKRRILEKQQEELSKEGLRVLGVASKPAEASLPKESWEEKLIFEGFVAFFDPIREGVKEAVTLSVKAGIKPIIVTGDYKWTACKVANDLHISTGEGAVCEGADLAHSAFLDNLEWEKTSVFSRVLPEHKMQIVKKLKERGEIVAMTGDGVNDAPALKMSDIGISMGKAGTEVAREASDLVLLDDSFATIERAIEEGRRIFDNIRKATCFLFSCNLSEILVVGVAIIAGLPLPLSPIELLWINLVTDGFPAIALGIEPPAPNLMERRPRTPGEGILTSLHWKALSLDGLLMGAVAFGLFLWCIRTHPGDLDYARTAVFTTMVLIQLSQSFVLSIQSRPLREIFANKALIVAVSASFLLQIAILISPAGRRFFDMKPLSAGIFFLVILASLTPFIKMALVRILKNLPPHHSRNTEN